MKKLILFLGALFLLLQINVYSQGVAINDDGTAPNSSAMLEVKSTNMGFLPPRMLESQMNAIVNPAEGLIIYCTDCVPKSIRFFNGFDWVNSDGYPELEEGEAYNSMTGEIWMDKNLGASQVAISSDDALAYGNIYQWGRFTDGHEDPTSTTTTSLSSTDNPGHSNFIIAPVSPRDWRDPQNDNLWQGVNGVNNPCPSGYRLPTHAEWVAEEQSWLSSNASGAFNSILKLTVAGSRSSNSGAYIGAGSSGSYWSISINGTESYRFTFNSSSTNFIDNARATGFSVRCIKD